MSRNTHRVYKMVSSYKDKDKQGNNVVVQLPTPKKKLLGGGDEEWCAAIAAKHEGGKVEVITGDMSQSEWL